MHFKKDAEVVNSDGEKAGTVDRVVLDPDSNEVTHLVVSTGFWLADSKVLPIELVNYSTDDQVVLVDDAEDLEDLPDFEQSYYVKADDSRLAGSPEQTFAPSFYWYPPMGTRWNFGAETGYSQPRYTVRDQKNIPDGTVAIQEGAEVISRDDEKVGEVERVITDQEHATHFVIAEGFILKDKKLIPVDWISQVFPDRIHLMVDAGYIEALPEFT